MYKLITIDIDGTLLNSNGEISIEDKEAILKAVNSGVEVVLASGRIINSIKTIANELGANNYLIAGNGALVYDIQNDKIIYSNYIKKEKVKEIINICEENSIFYTISTEDTIITKSLNYNVLFYTSENLKNEQNKRINITVVQDILEYLDQYEKNDFLKITVCDGDKIVFARILEILKQIKDVDVLDISHISRKQITTTTQNTEIAYCYTEITNKNVDKWSAIKFLANKLEIKDDEIICIGDNANDIEMVKNAGLGVAMENGMPRLKDEANIVTKSNNNNGIAHIINKFI